MKKVFDGAVGGLHEIREYRSFIKKTYVDMAGHCLTLRNTNVRSENEENSKSDSISAIINSWEYLEVVVPLIAKFAAPADIESEWGAKPEPDPAAEARPAEDATSPAKSSPVPAQAHELTPEQFDLRRLAGASDALRYIIMMVGYLTIPERINRWLERNDAEDVISFHRIFEDELPDEADRIRVLGLLASSPKRIRLGILDPVTGLIYRCAEPGPKQRGLLLKIVVAAVLCVGVLTAYVTMSYPNSTTWRPTSWGLSEAAEYVFSAWLMLLGGMAAQRMIARRKSKDPTAAELRLTLTRWASFAAAKATRIAETLLLSVVTLILYHSALKSGAPDPDAPDIISLSGAFFLGYGFDSFLDLVSSELDRRTSRNAALISFKPR